MPSPTAVTRGAASLAPWRRGFALVLLAFVTSFARPPAAGAATRIRPWMPSNLDSLDTWAAEARSQFRANVGDSLGGGNYSAYGYVANIGRKLLESLGRANIVQAPAVQPVMDSLGLDVEVNVDAMNPHFVLMMIHNPFRRTAMTGGFLYWYAGSDLRMQGVQFVSGRDVIARVWRTNSTEHPYSWGVVENGHYGSAPLRFTLLRLAQNGYYWTADQYPGAGLEFGSRGDASFVDLNNDNIPELITWTQTTADSLFSECMGCPHLITECTWVEREQGFELNETRLVPSTYATWVLFVGLLRSGSTTGASKLLADPSRLSDAIANHWDKGAGKALWQVVNVEPNTSWPHWMVVRRGHGSDAPSWVVHFILKDGRWIIRDWLKETVAPRRAGAR